MRSRFNAFVAFSAPNRCPPRIRSGAGFRRKMLYPGDGLGRREQATMAFDLILKGGRIIDPSQRLDRVADIGFAAGKVAKIGADLAGEAATDVRDVSGHIVAPGLIDLYTHVYWGGT